jgi:hypothetical protein
MNDHIDFIHNNSNASWYEPHDSPSLNTRIAFASPWVFIAVAGIIGKQKSFSGSL